MKEEQISPTAGSARAPRQGQSNLPQRILLVDDEISIRQVSTEMLIRSGYEVDSAADGAAGWEALQAKHYDLLITDNSMPKVTGVELVKMLRDHDQDAALPVIMASGAIPTEEMERHPWLEINAILLKPYTIAKLLATVNEVLRADGDAREQNAAAPQWRSQASAGDSQL